MHYAQALRTLDSGWTPALRRSLFNVDRQFRPVQGRQQSPWLHGQYQARRDPPSERLRQGRSQAAAGSATCNDGPGRRHGECPLVKEWSVDELAPAIETGLNDRDFDRGRALFAAAKCFACHRCNNEGGGVGPDLTGVAGRFSTRDLLESIVVPSKTISDQYESVTVATADGRVVTGRIVNLNGDNLMINPDMLDPNNMVNVPRSQIEEIKRSPVSMMPVGLLNTLNKDEILDLTAYLLSPATARARCSAAVTQRRARQVKRDGTGQPFWAARGRKVADHHTAPRQ